MPAPDPLITLIREWLAKADNDLINAAHTLKLGVTCPTETVCFHAQQCAEKYLKGLMEEIGLSVPKSHNLDVLLGTLKPYHPTLRPLRRGLVFLSRFSVNFRYPGKNASKRQAIAAVLWASRVRKRCRLLLGTRERPSGK